MRCRFCGRELEDGLGHCPICGTNVINEDDDPYVSIELENPVGPQKSSSSGAAPMSTGRKVNVTVGALFLIAVVGFAIFGGDEPTETVGDTTLTGYLVDDVVIREGGVLIHRSADDVQWDYMDLESPYLVHVRADRYEVKDYETMKGERFVAPGPGYYRVYLYDDGEQLNYGLLNVDGEISWTYRWTFECGGTEYAIRTPVSFQFSDYMDIAYNGAVRNSTTEDVLGFIERDYAVETLEKTLREQFVKIAGYDPKTGDQLYASFLLGFVQVAIEYPPSVVREDTSRGTEYYYDEDLGSGDMYLYGTYEYWIYPIETLYQGMGDCEDTSFLLASLLSLAGYKSSLAMMSDHVAVGVVVDEFERDPALEALGYKYTTFDTEAGTMYYCETTYSRQIAAGYLSPSSESDVGDIMQIYIVEPVAS
ncbi:MAG: hypothetical protein IJ856_01500 [Candidatus Methanomethylophilaceae archaeon]|nr:hypothetical protein [Candidatus Methanomethylophilaceae archaeon]